MLLKICINDLDDGIECTLRSPADHGGYQLEHELAMCPFFKEGEWYPDLH